MDKETRDKRNMLVEQIQLKCSSLYVAQGGLIDVGKELGMSLVEPSMHITVLLLGNHSAGKSTFINWYVGENIQKAGVAVETQGFTLIKHGQRRDTLLAEAALKLAPRFRALYHIDGVKDFLTMELSRSKEREFPLVTFVDTPGLVDGGLHYPFDVDSALIAVGEMADLVFVFLDPIGQALCRRTIGIVKQLAEVRAQPMTFCLSKSDETTSHADRQKVMVQIVQELCRNSSINRQGFEIKSIHIPGMARGHGDGQNHNQIEELCEEMTKAVSLTVQRSLNKLGEDCGLLMRQIESRMAANRMIWSREVIAVLVLLTSLLTVLVSTSTEVTTSPPSTASEKVSSADITQIIGWTIVLLLICIFTRLSNVCCLFQLHTRYKLRRMKNSVMAASTVSDELYSAYLD